MKHEDATAQLKIELARAKRAIHVERLAPAALVPILAAAAWAAASLFGFHDVAPPLVASLATLAALALIAWIAMRRARAYRPPTEQDARARLAADAGLDLGALDALEDHPARLDPMGMALWAREQERARDAALKATAAPPKPALNKADPLRLRYILAIAVVAGAILAGEQWTDRFARAFIPDPGPLLGDKAMEIEAWAAPATYTGAAPVSLSDRMGETVPTPPSVEATVRVTGPVGAPWLVFEGRGGSKRVPFQKAADGAWEAKLALPGQGALKVVRFHTKARWRIKPGADAAPKAAFAQAPRVEGEAVTFTWSAEDDYGVHGLKLRVVPADPPPGLKHALPVDTPIEGPSADPKKAEDEAELNLLAHAYAGMEVDVSVVAMDALGQEGATAPARIKLPEKLFLQPIARAAIEIRKQVMWEKRPYARPAKLRRDDKPSKLYGYDILFGTAGDPILTDEYDPRLERAPAAIKRAGRMIDALTMEPGDGYFQDPAVFAGLRGARAVINSAREIDEVGHAADVLWQVAMRAEYGDAADARRALLEAQRALSEAIARGASQEEIGRLSEAVRQAMQNYLQALAQEAIREGATAETQEDTEAQTQLSQSDIENLLKEVERLAQSGQTEQAMQLLQKLSQLLENLEIRLAESQEGEGGPQGDDKNAQLDESVEGLSEAIGKQRALRDETQKQGEEGAAPKKGDELAKRQEQLREELGKAEQKARDGGADPGEELGQAGEAMGEAEQALKRGDFKGAEKAQEDALRQLRAGADKLSKEILRREEGKDGKKQGESGQKDPLGRAIGAPDTEGDEVTVPDAMERQRAREILDELRKRAQDPRRPEAERDYLRRLLDRFTGS